MVVRLDIPKHKPAKDKRPFLTYHTKYWILTLLGLPYITLVLITNLYITRHELLLLVPIESNVTSRWFNDCTSNEEASQSVSIENQEILKPVTGSGNYIFALYNKSWSSYQSINDGRLVLKSYDGQIVLNKSIEQHLPIFQYSHKNASSQLLRRWEPKQEVLAFMHIGKNGGTSLRNALLGAQYTSGFKLQNLGGVPRKVPSAPSCACSKHYEWSYIEEIQKQGVKVAPLVMLRHPVQRAISHFHFAKTLAWTKGMEIRKLSLSEYLKNPKEMLNTRGVWQDGQAAVSWFTGTHLGNWAAKLKPEQVTQREQQSLNWTAMLDLAIENLHNSLWIGILEKMDQSPALLEYQTGLRVKMGHANRNSRSQADQPLEVTEKLRRLMPMDMFLYEYANELHDLRWRVYMNLVAEREANHTQHNTNSIN